MADSFTVAQNSDDVRETSLDDPRRSGDEEVAEGRRVATADATLGGH
jgi:hypothetical protein